MGVNIRCIYRPFYSGAHRCRLTFSQLHPCMCLLEGGVLLYNSSIKMLKPLNLPSSIGCALARSLSFTANALRKRKSISLSRPPTNTATPTPTTRINGQAPYDICEGGRRTKSATSPKVIQCSLALRPGMVLLKSFLTLEQQISIVRECRRLGVGAGGFYQPRRGVCRWLMCLGLDWNPFTNTYDEIRKFDNALPPVIPDEYLAMITSSVHAARACMEDKYPGGNAEKLVPMISPDTSLVNFYPAPGGKLVLHRDHSESRESLAKGIPIVSMTIGDSGVFCYGNNYTEMMQGRGTERVLMESGDILIFGGPARYVVHGLESVIPNSAPDSLVKETGLRPGRLNLTFRQY